MSSDIIRILAAWALIHESADEGWKAAVQRGQAAPGKGMEAGPDAFVDGLAAMVAEEKERLKNSLAAGREAAPGVMEARDPSLEELKFEMSLMRARLESIETTLDAILRRLTPPAA